MSNTGIHTFTCFFHTNGRHCELIMEILRYMNHVQYVFQEVTTKRAELKSEMKHFHILPQECENLEI